MDARTAGALRRRIVEQGWDQGSRLPFTRRLVLADPAAPVSPLTQAALDDAPPPGSGPAAVLQHPSEQIGSIVVTQLCDLAADPAGEPNVEALPVVRWPTESPLPQPNSCRHFVLDEDQRLVADATCRLVFEKPLLPDEPALPMLASSQDRRRFAAWLGRRATRAPFPDDFEATVATALRKVLARKQHAEHEVARTMGLWRVGLHGQASPQVSLLGLRLSQSYRSRF